MSDKTELTEWRFCEPFDIDNGELDGITPGQCFVLGVEWQMVNEALKSGREIDRVIHSYNVLRIRAMCERRGCTFTIEPTECEDWATLKVEPL